jgi:hypothetical protein
MFMHLATPLFKICSVSCYQILSERSGVIEIDPGAEVFVDRLITEIYHTTVVTCSKRPEEAVRQYLGIFCR